MQSPDFTFGYIVALIETDASIHAEGDRVAIEFEVKSYEFAQHISDLIDSSAPAARRPRPRLESVNAYPNSVTWRTRLRGIRAEELLRRVGPHLTSERQARVDAVFARLGLSPLVALVTEREGVGVVPLGS